MRKVLPEGDWSEVEVHLSDPDSYVAIFPPLYDDEAGALVAQGIFREDHMHSRSVGLDDPITILRFTRLGRHSAREQAGQVVLSLVQALPSMRGDTRLHPETERMLGLTAE